MDRELVTIVVPARNEESMIGRCLDSLLRQTVRDLQVIVVDGASKDGTAERVRQCMARDDRVELLSNPSGTVPAGLNLALKHTRGRWFVRVDAHATIHKDYVELVVRRLEEGRWSGVGGKKESVGVTPAGEAIAAAMGSRLGQSVYHHGTTPVEVDHIPFGAYPTSLARQLGGWDERLPVNQDYEFDYRLRKAGFRLLFDPHLSIAWHGRQSIRDLFRQYRRYGRGKADVAKLHPKSMRPRHYAPPAVVLVLAVCLPFVLRGSRVARATVLGYVAAVAAATAMTAGRVAPRALVYLPLTFPAMHIGWGIGFWEGLVHPGKPSAPRGRPRQEYLTGSRDSLDAVLP